MWKWHTSFALCLDIMCLENKVSWSGYKEYAYDAMHSWFLYMNYSKKKHLNSYSNTINQVNLQNQTVAAFQVKSYSNTINHVNPENQTVTSTKRRRSTFYSWNMTNTQAREIKQKQKIAHSSIISFSTLLKRTSTSSWNCVIDLLLGFSCWNYCLLFDQLAASLHELLSMLTQLFWINSVSRQAVRVVTTM